MASAVVHATSNQPYPLTAMDPLDSGSPKTKLWTEFRMSFASPSLQLAVLEDFGSDAAAYLEELDGRWYAAYLHAEALKEEDPEYDGDWLLFDRQDKKAVFIPASVAQEISEQLFPDGHDASDLYQASLGLVTVALHSALESFAQGHGVLQSRLPLPEAISEWLTKQRGLLDLEGHVSDRLVECDAVRHVYVHNRGVVDAKYINRVKNNRFVPGERRRLTLEIVKGYADAIWKAAARIREAA